MKTTKILTLVLILFSINLFAQSPEEQDNKSLWKKGNHEFINAFIDPTFTDQGAQFGASYTSIYEGKKFSSFAEIGLSHYNKLDPTYTDLVVTYGPALSFKKLDILIGGRFGLIYRGTSQHLNRGETSAGGDYTTRVHIYGLFGASIRLQYPISKKLYFGAQYWYDARQDLDNNFIRENGAFFISFKL